MYTINAATFIITRFALALLVEARLCTQAEEGRGAPAFALLLGLAHPGPSSGEVLHGHALPAYAHRRATTSASRGRGEASRRSAGAAGLLRLARSAAGRALGY